MNVNQESDIEFINNLKQINLLHMNQKLTNIISYFRNYSYPSEISPTKESQTSITKSLDQCISNAKSMIDLYEQKVNLLEVENESLHQDIQNLKMTITEDKIEAEKNLQKEKTITEELRKELIEKDFDYRILSEKIQQLEIAQADQLTTIKNQQNEDAQRYEDKIYKQKLQYEKVVKRLEEELQAERVGNSQLQARINELSQQLQSTIEENTKLHSFIQQPNNYQQAYPHASSSHKKYLQQRTDIYPTTLPQPFIPQLQIIDDYPINNSQDQILNYSYEEHPKALKDVLNFSGCNSSRFNMREFLRSKEKENVDDNVRMNRTNSSKRIYMSSQKRKLQMYSNSENNQKKPNLNQYNQHKIHQFTTTNEPNIDPYYVFFALVAYLFYQQTAQCIKINSKYFEQIAEIDIVDKEWEYVIGKRVPMNEWAGHLERVLMDKVRKCV